MTLDTTAEKRGVKPDGWLLSGPLAALVFGAGITALPVLVPGYDSVRQTVSEIGEVGSPAQQLFTATLLVAAICLLVFAAALRRCAAAQGVATLPAYLVACSAISAAGVGWFSFPHPLHNVFGPSELIGYQAPLAAALVWRKKPRLRSVTVVSAAMAALLWLALLANLAVFDRGGSVWAYERPIYGIVQRALFAAYFCWCAGAGWLLYGRAADSAR